MSSGSPISRPNGTWSLMRVFATGAMMLAFTPYLRPVSAALFASDTMPPLAAA